MARIVFISNYLKGGRNAVQLKNRVRYFATREGVELLAPECAALPATQKQQAFIARITGSFPESVSFLEYEDYLSSPTQGNAAAFIEQAWEQCITTMDKRENFIDYVSHRPGAVRYGEHGLWDADGKVENLKQAIDEVANHQGNVWTPVVSLRREDAERLNYDNAENWRALVNSCICDIAQGYKIHPDHLRWYAAFHEKEKQVHIHMVVFSTDPREGYLTKQGIENIKSAFARRIYQQDMICVYKKQTQYRNLLQKDAQARMAELITMLEHGSIHSEKLEQLTAELAERLKSTSGKKIYGYLPPALKRIVDEIVDELSRDERVSAAYALWQEMRDEICRTYDQRPKERLPLSQQKEFKAVRNMVIREALKLSEMTFTFEDKGMDDEPEETPQAEMHTERTRSVYRQAEDYRRAKQILSDESADTDKKAAALLSLERLWDDGYFIAAHQLGKAYRDGLATSANHDEAVKWFRRSADAGNDCSAYALGKLLLERGDTGEGIRWLEQAAHAENQFARYHLGKVYLMGEAAPKDVDAAIAYLTASAGQGNQYAQYTLGKLYLLGREVEQDKDAALRWLSLSAAQGNTYAQYFIDHMDDFHGVPAADAVLRMLHHMGNIFRDNSAADGIYVGMQIDKKLRRKMKQKKIAMGHKADDHEQEQKYIMKQ